MGDREVGYCRREDCRVGTEVVGGRYLGGTAPSTGNIHTGWSEADEGARVGTAHGGK